MRRFCTFLAVLAVAGVARAGDLDGIAVVVNDSVITYLQVEDRLESQIDNLRKIYGNDPTNFLWHQQKYMRDELEDMIRTKLVMDEFNRGEYTTNWVDDAVNDAIKGDIKDHYSGSRPKLIRTLQAAGLTYEDYKKQQRESIIVQALSQLHAGEDKIIVSPTAVEKYYDDHKDKFKVDDEVKLRMIRVVAPSPDITSHAMAAEIIQKIDGGVPFAEMAKVYSPDTYRERDTNSETGWRERKDLAGMIGDAAFSLKPGQHSQVLDITDEVTKSTTSYILMVDDIRAAHARTLAEAQGEIEQTLKSDRGKELIEKWIERLKEKSHVDYFERF